MRNEEVSIQIGNIEFNLWGKPPTEEEIKALRDSKNESTRIQTGKQAKAVSISVGLLLGVLSAVWLYLFDRENLTVAQVLGNSVIGFIGGWFVAGICTVVGASVRNQRWLLVADQAETIKSMQRTAAGRAYSSAVMEQGLHFVEVERQIANIGAEGLHVDQRS